MTKFRVGDIRPNPFRDLVSFPPSDEDIDSLRATIRTTGVWPTIEARLVDGYPQLAYGHSRIEAARREYGDDFQVELIIENLSDEDMVRKMGQENLAGRNRSRQDMLNEYIRAVVEGYAAGRWALPVPTTPSSRGHAQGRVAPSFMPRQDGLESNLSYTAATLAEFCGLSAGMVDAALAWLAQEEAGILGVATGISTRNGEEVVRAANAAKRMAANSGYEPDEQAAIARAVATDVTEAIRAGEASLHGSGKTRSIDDVRRESIQRHIPVAELPRREPPVYKVAQRLYEYVSTVFTRTYEGRGSYGDLLNAVAENVGDPAFQPDGPNGTHLDVEIAMALRTLATQATEYADRIQSAERMAA